MTTKLARRAPGGPGIEPRWTHGAKVAVGTAYSTSSRVWYTLDAGCVTEVFYPIRLRFGAIRPFCTFLKPLDFRRICCCEPRAVAYRLSRHFRPLRQALSESFGEFLDLA